jgi:hypothetical protein
MFIHACVVSVWLFVLFYSALLVPVTHWNGGLLMSRTKTKNVFSVFSSLLLGFTPGLRGHVEEGDGVRTSLR